MIMIHNEFSKMRFVHGWRRSKPRVKTALVIMVLWSMGAAFSLVSQWSTADTPASGNTGLNSPRRAVDRLPLSQTGTASFYARRYFGRTMADGTPMRPESSNAASLTLPLGSTARVTNLQTHLSSVVTIRDRGPYVAGRIIDLSPLTAREIGLTTRQGLAPVEVTLLSIPSENTGSRARTVRNEVTTAAR
jgi:rare lipoprotein A